jgi:uncharacterized membrane protein YfcA
VLAALLTTAFLTQAAVAVIAGFVRGFSGFGAALILAPGFTLVMPAQDAVVMTVLLNFSTVTQLLLPALRRVEWREMGPMGLAGAIGVPLGSVLLLVVDDATLRRAIGAVVLVFSIVMLAGWRYRGGLSLAKTMLAGGLGGVLTGSAGVGGPPVILYLLSGERPLADSRAAFIVFFAILQVVALPVFFMSGLISWELVGRTALLVPLYLAATQLGAYLFTRSSEQLARRLALGVLVVIGVATVLR